MNNFEVLKECKIAWEILNDLRDNCELLDDEDTKNIEQLHNRAKLDNTMDLLSDLYSKVWKLMLHNENERTQLETNIISHYGNKCLISDLIDYAYLDAIEDENMYFTECEADKKHYKSEDFDTLEQAYNEYKKVVGETIPDVEDESEDKNENVAVCNELIDDMVEELNGKLENKINICWWL